MIERLGVKFNLAATQANRLNGGGSFRRG